MLSSKTTQQKAKLALAWTCFFWGTTWIASKVGVTHMPAIQLCAIRQLLGGGVYLLYFIITKHPWPKGKQWGTILVLSVLNFMLSNGLSTWGVQYISSGLGVDHRRYLSFMDGNYCVVRRRQTTSKSSAGYGDGLWWCMHYFLRSPGRFFKHRFPFWNYDFCCGHYFMGIRFFLHKKACSKF